MAARSGAWPISPPFASDLPDRLPPGRARDLRLAPRLGTLRPDFLKMRPND